MIKILLTLFLLSNFLNANDFINFIPEDNVSKITDKIQLNKKNGPYLDRLKAMSLKNKNAAFNYASLIENINEKEAISNYKLSIKLGNYKAAYNLGLLYLKKSNPKQAEKYLRIALDHDIKKSLLPLAELTENKKMFLLAIDNNILNAKKSYLFFLKKTKDKGYHDYLLKMYKEKIDFNLFANEAYNKGDLEKFIKILKEGVSYMDKDSIYQLSYYYLDKNPAYSRELLSNEKTFTAYFMRGVSFYNQHRYKESLDQFKIYETLSGKKETTYINKICKSTNYCLEY